MLAEASVWLDAVDQDTRLDDHLRMHAPVRLRDECVVEHTECLVDADLRHVKDVRAGNEARGLGAVERTDRARSNMAAVARLRRRECVIEE